MPLAPIGGPRQASAHPTRYDWKQPLPKKDSHVDIPLEQLNFDAVDRMADYWCRRPKGRKTGMPIAIDTVRNHLKYLRAFPR